MNNTPTISQEDISEEGRGEAKKRVRKASLEWSMDSSLGLIHQVERFKTIWDSNSKHYRNRKINNNSWNTIAEALGLPKHEIMLRWNALRGNYQIHLKKKYQTKSEQAAIISKRQNPLFAEMKFLDPILKIDSKLRELNAAQTPNPTDLTSALPITVDSESNDSLPSSTHKRPRISEQSSPLERTAVSSMMTNAYDTEQSNSLERTAMSSMMANAYDVLLKSLERPNNDEWDALGNMIACNARTWSKENLAFARRYKAALSAVNAQFELEAAESTPCVKRTEPVE